MLGGRGERVMMIQILVLHTRYVSSQPIIMVCVVYAPSLPHSELCACNCAVFVGTVFVCVLVGQ